MHHHDDYFSDDKKLSRQERKRLSNKDRSKFKKTDKKEEAAPPTVEGLQGRVLSITSQGFVVDHDGESIVCSLKGALKKERTLDKNLVAVGDLVLYEPLSSGEGVIGYVMPRKSSLFRADNLSRLKKHLIAANIDQVLITTSLFDPLLKPSLVDRYVIASRLGGMEPIIVINKWELFETLDDGGKAFIQEAVEGWKKAGVRVFFTSTVTKFGIEELEREMVGKASVFSGQSGVGKSSLINLVTGMDFEVGETVKRTGKGAHTTTSAQLVRLKCGGFVIDTPGVQSFGLWSLERSAIVNYFPEIASLAPKCRFSSGCTHTHEPDCAVVKAVKKGKISNVRYESYLQLLESLGEEHKRR